MSDFQRLSKPAPPCLPPPRGFFARLARDVAGNTLAIVAASIAPILAMVGGGIDMGRSYLAESTCSRPATPEFWPRARSLALPL